MRAHGAQLGSGSSGYSGIGDTGVFATEYSDQLSIVACMVNLDMREPTFLVLTALAGGRMHGYALIGEAHELSDGRVRLKVGTLYAALNRLQAQGLVAAAGDEVVDGRLRRYYELTDNGANQLSEEAARLESNARQARVRLQLRSVPIAAAGTPA